ncbi:ferredoxin reductase [Cellulomonas endophytica]|uniref:ferredoxin reductase n=1 Tax=Cellulomonas endophytica TaxID=2494735 RepID=UPI0010131A63|nr:ferredoxin reductase [Cellulomonas endophytica]
MSGWLAARVAEVVPASASGRVLVLDVPGWPGNLAGQHLDLRLTAEDGYQAVRSYSVASVGAGERVELAVDEVPDGEVSPYLVQDVRPGDVLEVRGPLGRYFVWQPEDPGPVQLVAGGSGVVPLVAMVRAHAAARSPAPFRLLCSVRTPADAFYRPELEALVDDAFRLDWVWTRAAPPGWPGTPGRLTAAGLAAAALPPEAGPTVYVCGPTGFVEAAASLLVAAGHPPGRIRTERFGGS